MYKNSFKEDVEVNDHKQFFGDIIMKKNLRDLLIDELHDILSSEEQVVKALPDMVKASESADLKHAFSTHLQETKGQIKRLEKVFKLLKAEKKEKFCQATKGLIQECREVLKEFKTKSSLRDAALIAKAQRIEHYEIAAYGTVRTFAKELGFSEVAHLLQETLNEEGNTDKKLTKIAEGGLLSSGINQQNLPDARDANDSNEKAKHPKKKKVAAKKPHDTAKKTKVASKTTKAAPKKSKAAPKKVGVAAKKPSVAAKKAKTSSKR